MDNVVEQPSTGAGQQFSHYRIGGTLGEGASVGFAWPGMSGWRAKSRSSSR